ncbi:MAG: hypothetical protein IPJ34_43185 [Myxococcales bacterium]|nr:hypothetical protein [Myxococcales bacterium]
MEPATKPVAMAPRTKPVEPKATSSASVVGPCDPPWRVDDAGVRTFKAECL